MILKFFFCSIYNIQLFYGQIYYKTETNYQHEFITQVYCGESKKKKEEACDLIIKFKGLNYSFFFFILHA